MLIVFYFFFKKWQITFAILAVSYDFCVKTCFPFKKRKQCWFNIKMISLYQLCSLFWKQTNKQTKLMMLKCDVEVWLNGAEDLNLFCMTANVLNLSWARIVYKSDSFELLHYKLSHVIFDTFIWLIIYLSVKVKEYSLKCISIT